MANTCATEPAGNAAAKSNGQLVAFPASYKAGRKRRSDLRAQFERLLIFVLCALWGLGIALWALAAVSNWTSGHTVTSASTELQMMVDSPINTGVHLPVVLVKALVGWD
ncbi:MAG: hypothetical protein JWO13_3364 [Acidobacteriales bacterium]|nr:hypothetical protein [Terriglobales bacterium]